MRCVALIVLTALIGCAAPEARSFHVGQHAVRIVVPREWEALDRGKQLILRHEEEQLILADEGPATPRGFRDEIEHARDLWRNGHDDEAQTRLRDLPVQRAEFEAPDAAKAFRSAWSAATSARGIPYGVVASELDSMIAATDTMKPLALGDMADDRDPRREVKSRVDRSVDGHSALDIETWSTLTHADPRHLILISNAGRVLSIRCDRCDAAARTAFESVMKSLHFASGSRT